MLQQGISLWRDKDSPHDNAIKVRSIKPLCVNFEINFCGYWFKLATTMPSVMLIRYFSEAFGGIPRSEAKRTSRFAWILLINFHLKNAIFNENNRFKTILCNKTLNGVNEISPVSRVFSSLLSRKRTI